MLKTLGAGLLPINEVGDNHLQLKEITKKLQEMTV